MQANSQTIWYQIYPLGFSGAAIRPGNDDERALSHRLRHITSWLDHIAGMGFTGLLLGPIFTSATHGYDTLDHRSIDPRLGDDADFDELVAACHARGLAVALDGVFNHVAVGHPWLKDNDGARVFEGHGDLVVVDHSDPFIIDDTAAIMTFWNERGVDAWRFDAAYAIDPSFWAGVLPQVAKPVWTFAEMIHGDYAAYQQTSGIDSVTQYELWKSIWSSIQSKNMFELDWTLQRNNELLEAFVPQTFIGNHDVTRIATLLGDEGAKMAATILFTMSGTPSVYYGDERAYLGEKKEQLGGDDYVRPMFPATPGQWTTGADMEQLYRTLIGLRRANPWLTRANTTSMKLTNEHYQYEVTADGHRWWVDLDVSSLPIAVVTDSSGVIFKSR